ncbi:TPA: hypothetical protein ACNVX4_006396 [Pseudomonas aeruginosa]
MQKQQEHQGSGCNVENFSSGFKVWWASEMQSYLSLTYSAVATGGTFAIILLVFVHVFFPIGVLLSALLPADAPAPASYLAFEHVPEVVLAFTSLGFAPFMALAAFAVWLRHVCSLGKSNP